MKKTLYHIVGCAILLIAGIACTDETFTGMNAGDGKSVEIKQFTLLTDKEDDKDIPLTKAEDNLSAVRNVTLFVFNENGRMEDFGDLDESGQIEEYETTEEGCKKYKLSGGGLEATTGKKTVYAIANRDAPFWQSWQSCMDELKDTQLTVDEFREKLFTINQRLINTNSLPGFETDYVILTGLGTDIEVQENGTASGFIYVKRPVAQINFQITTHTEKTEEDGTHIIDFTPSTYRIYRVPKQCLVFNNEGIVPAEGSRDYYDIRTHNAPEAEQDGISYISFYMPENTQELGTNNIENGYHERDKWDGYDKNGNKKWSYAPENSTYIVIEGDYVETDENNTLVYQGKVSYTIHLGDFSDEGSMNNFSVRRNVRYTYHMSVLGVNNIKVEAETDKENQSGAEGNIIGTEEAAQIFDLDCHYEQVFVSYNLTQIANSLKNEYNNNVTDEAIADAFMLWSSTPFNTQSEIIKPYNNSELEEEEATAGMDYKWISFYPQRTAQRLSAYPGSTSGDLLTPYQLCRSLGAVVRKIIDGSAVSTSNKYNDIWITQSGGAYYAYFTAFIDEYYYDKNPVTGAPVAWGDFTNKSDRTMIIASSIAVSTDGNSTYSKARTSFTQRSIQTFYNADADESVNAMGLETYCENKLFSFYNIRDNYEL